MAQHTISQTKIKDILKHVAGGMSQDETARRVGVSHTTVAKYVKAANETRAKRVKALEKGRKVLAAKRAQKQDFVKEVFETARLPAPIRLRSGQGFDVVPHPSPAPMPDLPAVMQKTAPARLLALGELAQIAIDAKVPLEHLMKLARSVYA